MPTFLLPGDPSLTQPSSRVDVEDISSESIQSTIDHMLHIAIDIK